MEAFLLSKVCARLCFEGFSGGETIRQLCVLCVKYQFYFWLLAASEGNRRPGSPYLCWVTPLSFLVPIFPTANGHETPGYATIFRKRSARSPFSRPSALACPGCATVTKTSISNVARRPSKMRGSPRRRGNVGLHCRYRGVSSNLRHNCDVQSISPPKSALACC